MTLRYDLGLDEMKLLYINRTPEEYLEFLALEARLRTLMRETRLFGSSQDTTAETNRVVYELNRVALEKFKKPFNDICQVHSVFHVEVVDGIPFGISPGEREFTGVMEYVPG